MKLFYNPPSPYARKTLIAAHETGMIEKIELRPVDPWSDPPELLAATPIGKVPAFLTDTDELITESTTICLYLDAASQTRPLASVDMIETLTRTALAQGLTDAAFGIVIERRRPENSQLASWVDRLSNVIRRTLPRLEAKGRGFDLGDISLASALSYMDFRLSEFEWRKQRPDLSDWLDSVSERNSMMATRP